MEKRGISPSIKFPQTYLRELRERRGLSRQQLADLAGTNKEQIYKLERGERELTPRWMVRLAPHLDCEPADFIARRKKVPVMGYIGASENVTLIKNFWPVIESFKGSGIQMTDCELVDAPAGVAHSKLLAWRVEKDWEGPFIREGDKVFTSLILESNFESYLNSEVIVELKSGEVLLKTLERGTMPGKYNLLGHQIRIMRDVDIKWCAQIVAWEKASKPDA